jgi:hypothetical protein
MAAVAACSLADAASAAADVAIVAAWEASAWAWVAVAVASPAAWAAVMAAATAGASPSPDSSVDMMVVMNPQYPKGSLADLMLSGRTRKATVHTPTYIEQEAPNAYWINCSCGWHWVTLWGLAAAEQIWERHRSYHGATPKVIV